MVKEKGVIVKIDATTAWVKTTKSSACEACESRDKCNTLGGGKEIIVETRNTINGKVGDNVIISFNSNSLFKLSLLLYIFPILCMIAGAASGEVLAIYTGGNNSMFQVVIGFIFFGISIVVIKRVGQKLASKREYKSEIIKIINSNGYKS